ncbi:MBL fold metallo-hydrolase [soil metagenome]
MTTKVAQIEVGPMSNFSYIIADDNSKFAAIVDPSWDLEKILRILEKEKWQAKMIINTHNHFDHIQGNEQIAAATGAPILQYALSGQKGNHVTVKDGEQIKLGDTVITVLHTPGHSKESICLLVDDKFVFTGDTLFVESCGRIDLAGGDVDEMYDSLLNKVRQLNEQLIVYPGHNYGSSPWSTISKEKKNNPTLQPRSRQDFSEYMTS